MIILIPNFVAIITEIKKEERTHYEEEKEKTSSHKREDFIPARMGFPAFEILKVGGREEEEEQRRKKRRVKKKKREARRTTKKKRYN